MKTRYTIVLASLSMLCLVTTANADNSDLEYAAIVDQVASATYSETAAISLPEISHEQIDGFFAELKKTSPSAFSTYQHLTPEFQEEVISAIQQHQDIYSVMEMIFQRNS